MNLLKKKIFKKFFVLALSILLFAPVAFSLPENSFPAKIDLNIAYAEGGIMDKLGEFVTDFIWGATVWIPYKILVFVGHAFDFIFKNTVINFAGWYNGYFASSASAVWNISQSIANLIIISMFVFSAIATILRIESYELKQFIVKILIVAVLINFSMFFTKLAIDVSNTVAYSIYKSSFAKAGQDSEKASIGDTIAYLTGFAQKSYGTDGKKPPIYDSDWGAFLMFVLIMAPFMLFSAGILIYGTIVMLTRALGLLFVIALSALGFVAMIIPKAEHLWEKWWKSLLTYSLFAPAFTLLLYIDYVLIANMKDDIASLIIDKKEYAIAMINSFVIAGSLLLAIKLANELSIAGSKFAGRFTGGALSLGFRYITPALSGYSFIRKRALRTVVSSKMLGKTTWGERLQYRASQNLGDIKHIGDTLAGAKLRDKFGIDLGQSTKKIDSWEKSKLKKAQNEIKLEKLEKAQEKDRKKLEKMGLAPDEIERVLEQKYGSRQTYNNTQNQNNIREEAIKRAERDAEAAKEQTRARQSSAEEAEQEARKQEQERATAEAQEAGKAAVQNADLDSQPNTESSTNMNRSELTMYNFLRKLKQRLEKDQSYNIAHRIEIINDYHNYIERNGLMNEFDKNYRNISEHIKNIIDGKNEKDRKDAFNKLKEMLRNEEGKVGELTQKIQEKSRQLLKENAENIKRSVIKWLDKRIEESFGDTKRIYEGIKSRINEKDADELASAFEQALRGDTSEGAPLQGIGKATDFINALANAMEFYEIDTESLAGKEIAKESLTEKAKRAAVSSVARTYKKAADKFNFKKEKTKREYESARTKQIQELAKKYHERARKIANLKAELNQEAEDILENLERTLKIASKELNPEQLKEIGEGLGLEIKPKK